MRTTKQAAQARDKEQKKQAARRVAAKATEEIRWKAIGAKALKIRDAALEAYSEVANHPDAYDDMDPGDAEVTLEGNGHNVLRVLNFLDLLGVPGCAR